MTQPLTGDQAYALQTLLEEWSDEGVRFLTGHILGLGILETVTVMHWELIRDRAYPNWNTGDWEALFSKFEDQLAASKHAYLEHLGQGNLFE